MTQKTNVEAEDLWYTLSTYFRNLPSNIKKSYIRTSQNARKDFKEVYLDSGITLYLDDYVSRGLRMVAASLLVLSVVSYLVYGFLFRWAFMLQLSMALITGVIGSCIIGLGFALYPYYRRGEAKTQLEDGLVYFLSYMAVLSASGMSIERILERIIEVEENVPLVHLAKKFMMNVKLFGMNVRTALKDISEMSPSRILTKQLEGISTAIATSGDLKNLLVYEVDRQLQVKREKLKSRVNTLVYIGELYVALMVVTPTLFILIIAILSVMGGVSVGGNPVIQLNLIVFFGIPILGAVFTVLLDQTMGRDE